jgi:hypothetical protein
MACETGEFVISPRFVYVTALMAGALGHARADEAQRLPSPLGMTEVMTLARTHRAEIVAARSRVFGPDLEVITKINDNLERVLRTVPHTRSVYAERELGGFLLDDTPDRDAIARYGLSARDVLDVVKSSIGGMDVATTYEGRERFKINVRYPRELRDSIDAIRNVLVPIALVPIAPLTPRGGASGGVASAIPAIYVVWRSFHLAPPKDRTGKLGEAS